MKVKLIKAEPRAAAEEYHDLVFTTGKIKACSDGLTYFPEGRTDWLTMTARSDVQSDGKRVIKTALGNRFTFEVLSPKS